MRILVLGGSGRTGLRVIDVALGRGHAVTALVRNTRAVPAQSNLTAVQGTPLNPADIATAFQAHNDTMPESVIVTLNPSRESDSPFSKPVAPPRLLADSVANTIQMMRQHHTRKLVVMQAMGVGDSFPNLSMMMRWVARNTYMSASYTDHNLTDEEVRNSGINYVLARPPWLTNGARRHVKCFGNQGEGMGGISLISRDSVADFLVDAAEKPDWDMTTPVIATHLHQTITFRAGQTPLTGAQDASYIADRRR